jgi:hypothetical protein
MKIHIIFLFIFLFAGSVTFISAQPECNEAFNPFYICQSNFERSDYFFYGEIVSMERLKDDTVVNSTSAYYKMNVKVKKSFKGNLPKEISLYVGYLFTCHNLAVKNKYLFQVVNANTNNQKVYFAQNISRPMTDYSAKAVNDVFANIESVLSNQKRDFVEGAVFEWLLKIRKVSIKNEDADRLSVDLQNRQPLTDILIEAVSEKDGKVYQAKSKADGTFRIDNIPNGIYKIKLHLPPDKQQQIFSLGTDGSPCSRKWYIMVMPQASK